MQERACARAQEEKPHEGVQGGVQEEEPHEQAAAAGARDATRGLATR